MAEFTLTQVFLIWIVGFGVVLFLLKNKISNIFLKSKLPRIVNYYIILTPLVLIEEFLTCETPFFSCIAVTLPAFYLFFILLYFIHRFTKMSYIKAIILFGLLGWFNEFILVGRINQLDISTIILFTVLVIPIYSVVAILPSYYLEKSLKN